MLIQAQVGPAVSSTSLGAGTNPNLRLDNLGGLTGTQLLPRYYEMTYRRQTYTIANQSGVTTSAALTTTYVGLCIANPTTSTINTVITKVGYAFTVAPVAAMVVGIMLVFTHQLHPVRQVSLDHSNLQKYLYNKLKIMGLLAIGDPFI